MHLDPGMSRKEILEHIFPTDRLLLAYCGSYIVGCATDSLRDEFVVYLSGTATHEDIQT